MGGIGIKKMKKVKVEMVYVTVCGVVLIIGEFAEFGQCGGL